MKKSVLFITHDASSTGAPIFLLRFIRWVSTNRPFPFSILVGKAGPLSPEFASTSPIETVNPSETALYKLLRRARLNQGLVVHHKAKLAQNLSTKNIGLIYANSLASAEIVKLIAPFLDCPIICHAHELESSISIIGKECVSLMEGFRPNYIAVSQAVSDNLRRHGIPENRITTIHGFVPSSPLIDKAAAKRSVYEELNLRPGAMIGIGCGSIEHRKGCDLFIEVAKRCPSMNFVWVGGRSHMSGFDELASVPNVYFIGPRCNVDLYLAAADIFILPSRSDPFPLVMLEAAFQAVPTLCFRDSGGAQEFVEHDAGIVVPYEDVNAMAGVLDQLTSSPERIIRMGNAAKSKVQAKHELKIGAQKLCDMIELNLC